MPARQQESDHSGTHGFQEHKNEIAKWAMKLETCAIAAPKRVKWCSPSIISLLGTSGTQRKHVNHHSRTCSSLDAEHTICQGTFIKICISRFFCPSKKVAGNLQNCSRAHGVLCKFSIKTNEWLQCKNVVLSRQESKIRKP